MVPGLQIWAVHPPAGRPWPRHHVQHAEPQNRLGRFKDTQVLSQTLSGGQRAWVLRLFLVSGEVAKARHPSLLWPPLTEEEAVAFVYCFGCSDTQGNVASTRREVRLSHMKAPGGGKAVL